MGFKDFFKKKGIGESFGEVTKRITKPINAALSGNPRLLKVAAGAWESIGKVSQLQSAGTLAALGTVSICAWLTSEVTGLLVEDFIPDPRSTSRPTRKATPAVIGPSYGSYSAIRSRNLFNSLGKIPGLDKQPTEPRKGPAVKTSLPLKLIGTLILQDSRYSLATIKDTSTSRVFPVQINDQIEDKVKILQVEARKVTFLNLKNRRKEFVDLPDEFDSGPVISAVSTKKSGSGVSQSSPNRFNISRAEVDKSLGNLTKVLTQARAVPNYVNGVASGYKLFQIVPGSIYDKLGLKNQDVISNLNGEEINDPSKAFELLNELKFANHVELTIRRGGKDQVMIYDIAE